MRLLRAKCFLLCGMYRTLDQVQAGLSIKEAIPHRCQDAVTPNLESQSSIYTFSKAEQFGVKTSGCEASLLGPKPIRIQS